MLQLASQIRSAIDLIRSRCATRPQVGIVLGTGLGDFTDEIERDAIIPYDEIPHFPQATALSHKSQWVCGQAAGVPVVAMEGRFHLYEGYSAAQITLPVRVMKALGIETLIVSNASGGLNPQYASGDIMVLDDHIHLMFDSPLFGVNDDRLGPRFPDMSQPYSPELIEQALAIARQNNFVAHRGTYAALSGPNYETRAEYRFLRQIGADVVGMSTTPEVIVAVHANLRVLALSAVTNLCRPDVLTQTTAEEVVAAAQTAEPKMRAIVLGILKNLS